MYYDEAEKLSRPEIERLQLERLRKSLAQAAKSPFYSALFREHDVRPDAVRTMPQLFWVSARHHSMELVL